MCNVQCAIQEDAVWKCAEQVPVDRVSALETDCFPRCQLLLEPLDRQPDHVTERAGNTFHDQIAFLLDGVAAGLVEREDLGQVPPDLPEVKLAESDRGADREKFLAVGTEMNEANAGDYLVGASLELHQHLLGVRQADR